MPVFSVQIVLKVGIKYFHHYTVALISAIQAVELHEIQQGKSGGVGILKVPDLTGDGIK